jgi:hypothetical protein
LKLTFTKFKISLVLNPRAIFTGFVGAHPKDTGPLDRRWAILIIAGPLATLILLVASLLPLVFFYDSSVGYNLNTFSLHSISLALSITSAVMFISSIIPFPENLTGFVADVHQIYWYFTRHARWKTMMDGLLIDRGVLTPYRGRDWGLSLKDCEEALSDRKASAGYKNFVLLVLTLDTGRYPEAEDIIHKSKGEWDRIVPDFQRVIIANAISFYSVARRDPKQAKVYFEAYQALGRSKEEHRLFDICILASEGDNEAAILKLISFFGSIDENHNPRAEAYTMWVYDELLEILPSDPRLKFIQSRVEQWSAALSR